MTIELHPTATISHLADLEASVRGSHIRVGAHSSIDSFVKLKPAGGCGDIEIGEYSVINSGCVIYSGNGVRIGDYVAIAANCVFASTNHAFSDRNRLIRQQGFMPSRGGILVEDDVWVGAACTILDGAILRQGCVIGAMSLVRGEIPAHTIWAGNPIRQVGVRR